MLSGDVNWYVVESGGGSGPQPLSLQVVYASRAGVPAIASLASPLAGPDATAALQAILNLARSAPLELVIDQPCLAGNLSVYSGTMIRGVAPVSFVSTTPAVGLWQRTITNGTDSCILKNAHRASNFGTGLFTRRVTS